MKELIVGTTNTSLYKRTMRWMRTTLRKRKIKKIFNL